MIVVEIHRTKTYFNHKPPTKTVAYHPVAILPIL
jgi:hypothetical protein